MNLEWHEKKVRRISETDLGLALYGKMLMVFSIGSIYSIQLVQYGYFILVAATLIIASYLRTSFMNWYKNTGTDYPTHFFGFTGGILLILFTGIQLSQVPFKIYLLILGFLFILPAFISLLGGKRK